ncbi:TonB-dependent receptor [Labilibacter sediminis]|nr:TonB-dependent receptor [Labilibacter sediminis]
MKKKIIAIGIMAWLCILTAMAQNITITGNVKDDTDMGLPGASVLVKGTTSGTITDIDGNFSLEVSGEESVIIISFVGFGSQEYKVGTKRFFDVKMSSNLDLDEVVIVGFGTQKKANATGAVKTIDTKAIESRPISSVADGLQGVIAGLNISNDQGGAPGQAMDINIRGVGTIGEGSSSSPLVLIDGLEGDISSVNPNDIENISVLKDAASASIYGSRAPFGVILITTKSGDKKKEFTYSSNLRLSQPLNIPDVVDSYTYALMINDANLNAGGRAQFPNAQLDKILRYQRGELEHGSAAHPTQNRWINSQQAWANTDWYDVHLNSIVPSQEHNLSLSGGGDKVVYYFSGNYLKQNGLFKYADDNYKRFSVNGRVNVKLNDKLNLNWNTKLVTTENNKPSALNGLFFHNLGRRFPVDPVMFPNGDYNPRSLIPSLQNGGRQVQKKQLLYNQAKLTFEPVKNWKIYADLGSRIENPRNTRQFKKLALTQPDGTQEYYAVLEGVTDVTDIRDNGTFRRQPPAGTSYYEKGYGYVNYVSTNFRTDYEMTRDKHFFKVLAGVQTEYYYTETTRLSSDNILLDDTPFLPSGPGDNPMMSEKKGEWSNLGIFSRINYVFADKYMVEANLRADGASRFPEDQRWGVFPSFSFGWNLAQENFMKGLSDKGFEMIKLRASYGQLGNQNTQSFYPYFQHMLPGVGGIVLGGDNATVLPAPAPFTTDLTWERIENVSAGLDFAFWGNRFGGAFDWYRRVTKNMVGPAKPLPAVFGAEPPKTNNAELQTDGWELELFYRDRIGSDFSYDISFSLSDYQSEVTKYDSPDGSLDNFFVGKKIGDIWGYQVEGIAKTDLEMQQWQEHTSQSQIGAKWGAGDFMYKDIDGSGSINAGGNSIQDPGDLSVIGNGTPRYMYGLRLGGKYKFVDFSVFFQGVGKRDVFFKNSATFFGVASQWQRSLFTEHLDYFRPAGDPLGANLDSYYARISIAGNNKWVNDHYMQDASYLRLKNVQVGFNLPKQNFMSEYVQKARLYFSAENIWTHTDLMILDPEAIGGGEWGGGKTYPMYGTFAIGLSVTF